MKPNYRDIALEFIRQNPGATGLQISDELERYFRSASPGWFHRIFGRPTIGTTYALLDRFEEEGLVRSEEGRPTAERGWRKPLHFYVT